MHSQKLFLLFRDAMIGYIQWIIRFHGKWTAGETRRQLLGNEMLGIEAVKAGDTVTEEKVMRIA